MKHAGMASKTLQEAGFDDGLIESNLRLTYEDRVLRHQAALDLALALEASGSKLRGRSETVTRTSVRR
jgi:hypothetical protein